MRRHKTNIHTHIHRDAAVVLSVVMKTRRAHGSSVETVANSINARKRRIWKQKWNLKLKFFVYTCEMSLEKGSLKRKKINGWRVEMIQFVWHEAKHKAKVKKGLNRRSQTGWKKERGNERKLRTTKQDQQTLSFSLSVLIYTKQTLLIFNNMHKNPPQKMIKEGCKLSAWVLLQQYQE